MKDSINHEKEIQKMQMENLMLQINPHFIYNTMNSIVYMARMSGKPEIADFTNAFISLLQNTLKVRNSIYNDLGDELKNVKNYLYLQEFRYGNKFTYELICPEEFKECRVLNVMLQPVVENAIFHGIAPKDGPGRIEIRCERESDSLKVTVADDGMGIAEDMLKTILREDYTQNSGVHKIGLGNVRKRIQDTFGERYTLVVKSEVGKGTQVIMTVPYIKIQKVE